MTVRELIFPDGFLWGAATASLQVEGASATDGRKPSVWDEFCQLHPERVYQAATPTVACDHYNRYEEDVAFMHKLGHNTYRFSIAWPRVVPEGRGALNKSGLDFYDRLVDKLLANSVEPNVTLYHWDLPLSLAQKGGWENPETVDAFLQYAEHCFDRLGDRVSLWSSINEPAWTILNGYITGLHPPCKRDRKAALLAAHHLLVSHSLASQIKPCGIALNLSPVYPASETEEDKKAANLANLVLNDWFVNAVLEGRYPQELAEVYQRQGLMPESPYQLEKAPLSFMGINYYYPHHARADAPRDEFHINNTGQAKDSCLFSLKGCFSMVKNPNGRYTDWAWEIHPETLTTLLLNISKRAPQLDLYITENGIGRKEEVIDDCVPDQERIHFLKEHLEATHQAISKGAKVKGYYMWALMDNFSWINGYKKRYGFLHVDRETMKRTPKESAFWFCEVAKQNKVIL